MTGREEIPDLSIVLPAYEEARSLESLLPALRERAGQISSNYEILVIDSETPRDDTESVCSKHGVRYLRREGGPQYGNAIRTAQRQARGEFIVLMDADGSHGPRFISSLWPFRQTADLVIASRYVSGGRTENPAILIFMSKVVNIGFRIVLGLNCHDVSNSFRLYRGDDFRNLSLECDHFDIVEEILIKLCLPQPDYRIKEVPFTFEKRKAGKTKRQLWDFAFGYIGTLFHLFKLKCKARQEVRGNE